MTVTKTSELIGPALDWAVAKCEGWSRLRRNPHKFAQFLIMSNDKGNLRLDDFSPSTDWEQGGPIIEREKIDLLHRRQPDLSCEWEATIDSWETIFHGPTLLIAAMRCYVASKLGDEVEIPDELLAN